MISEIPNLSLISLLVATLGGAAIGGLIMFLQCRSQLQKNRFYFQQQEREWHFERSRMLEKSDQLQSQVEMLGAQLKELQIKSQQSEQDGRQLESQLSASRATLETLISVQEKYERVNEEVKQLRERNAQLETRLQEQQRQRQEEEALLASAKRELAQQFEQTAHRLFDAKQQQFTQSSKSNLEQILSPFKQQLGEFHKRVEDIYHKENSQRNQLVGQIAELQKQAQQISADAVNLAQALKGDNKLQGNWGEVILERLLEQSGLEKGREYETQVALRGEAGNRLQPDVIVRLPDGKDIIIDAKVSLLHYQSYYASESDQEQELALKAHIESLRAHVKGLSLKSYEALEGVRTLDFVFIFVPIEAAYLLALQHAPNLFKEAYDKNIVLVSPSSLMVALRTVETIWRHEKQNKNAEKMALTAGRLYDQFAMVAKALEELGTCLGKTHDAYDTTWRRLAGGRGNLIKRLEEIRKLGAKTTKSLPDAFTSEVEDEIDVAPEVDEAKPGLRDDAKALGVLADE